MAKRGCQPFNWLLDGFNYLVKLKQGLSFALAAQDILVKDNESAALEVKEGSNAYITIKTSNGSEEVLVSKSLALALGLDLTDAAQNITLKDNEASALDIREGSNSYLKIVTTDAGEKIVTSKSLEAAGGVVGDVTGNVTGDVTGEASENTTQGNGLRSFLNQALLDIGTLAISATPEQFKTTTTALFLLSGAQRSKTAEDNLTFSAADTINTAGDTGDFHGAWLVQTDKDGTVSTKPAGGLSDQVYTSKANAVAALPAADADNVALGYITVQANTDSSWTANTDDLTDASDCAEATFVDATPDTLPAAIS